MSGVSHWICPKCKERLARWGEIPESVTCDCGHTFDASADKRIIEKIRAEMTEESQREWDARTPEQEAAWEAGRVAYRQYVAEGEPPIPGTRVRSAPLACGRRCPYPFVRDAKEQHPLRAWWYRGWTHEEFEPTPTASEANRRTP